MGFVAPKNEQVNREQGAGQQAPDPLPYATGTVHHDAVLGDGSVLHHHQVFESGQLVAWERDDTPGPWALVRTGDPRTPCPTGVASPHDVAAVTVRRDGDALVLPLLDDLPDPVFGTLRRVPDATARLRFEVFGSPVGTQYAEVRYQDGSRTAWLVDDWQEPREDEPAFGAPEMHVRMSFRNYLRMRSGEATALEAIEEGGTVDARWTLLLLLHGLIQSPEYVAAYRGMAVLPPELGWWGEVAPFIGDAVIDG